MATEATKIPFVEAAAPSTPAASRVVIYAKSDGLMYSKDDAGAETLMSGGAGGLTDHNHTGGGDGGDLDAPVIDGHAIFNEEVAPSTPAAATVALYAKSDGLLYSKDDAGTETLVSGGAGSASVPGWLAAFIGTTDATNFYWDGNDLAGFTEQTVTGSATWSEGLNCIRALVANQTADDVSAQLIAKTFSVGDEWVLAINTTMLGSDSGGSTAAYRALGLIFSDGTATTANCVIGHIQVDNGAGGGGFLLVGRHGTLTNINSGAPWVSINQPNSVGNWLWIKLIYQATDTFRLQFGPTKTGPFTAFGESDISKTMTPTHVGLFAANFNAGTAIAQFGPLLKVA